MDVIISVTRCNFDGFLIVLSLFQIITCAVKWSILLILYAGVALVFYDKRQHIWGSYFYVSVIFWPWGFECAGLNSLCLEAAICTHIVWGESLRFALIGVWCRLGVLFAADKELIRTYFSVYVLVSVCHRPCHPPSPLPSGCFVHYWESTML